MAIDRSQDVGDHVEEAARKAHPWIDRIARAGYVAKGVVYVTVGILAGQVALGVGGKTTGPGGAVGSIGSQPFGQVMIVLLAIGLLGYALWKLVQGIMDPDDKGSDLSGMVRRVGYVGSAAIHGGLAFSALDELFGVEGQSTSLDAWTAEVMSHPFGRWLVALVAMGVIGVGFFQLYAGVTAKYREDLKTYQMGDAGRLALATGRIGTTARAIVILVSGAFLLLAAYQADPSETRGLGDTLETLIHQPLGPYCVGAISAGLVLYGVFMFVVARYRHIETT